MFHKIILLFFVVTFVNGYSNIFQCSNITTPIFNVDINKISRLQSPKFPKNIGSNLLSASCNAVINTNSSNANIWIVMLNGAAREIELFDSHNISKKLTVMYYKSTFDAVTFTTDSNALTVNVNASKFSDQWTAFQALVVAYPINIRSTQCPLANQTFDFSSDANLVIPVSPTFDLPDLSFSFKLCNWYFSLGPNQQLKVVVKKMNLADNITLTLTNEKFTTVSFTNGDVNKVFYIDGKTFDLAYKFNHANFSNSGFSMLVSAVTTSLTYTSNGCKTPATNGANQLMIYSNIDYINGYPAYQKCNYIITVPVHHEAILYITEYDYEGIADKLTLTYGNSETAVITWGPGKDLITYTLTSNVTDGELVFTSDGNTQGAGYTVYLDTYSCNCSKPVFVIQCNTEAVLLPMDLPFANKYCSNMDCSYTIVANSSCPNSYFNTRLINLLRDSDDYLLIKENGILDQNISAANPSIMNRYYSPKNNVSIQFHSGPSINSVTTVDKGWYIHVSTMPSPVFKRTTLNETNSKYALWMSDLTVNDAISVCTSVGTLEIFVSYPFYLNDLTVFKLYDSADLNNFVGSLIPISTTSPSGVRYLKSRKSSSGCFTIYVPEAYAFVQAYSVVFRIAEESTKNCEDSNNVFQAPSGYTAATTEFDATVKSKASGSCEMIILPTGGYSEPSIWISNISASDNLQYSGYSTVNNKKLFEFNGSEASEWQSFGIYTPALTIVVPPSSSISVHLSGDYQLLQWITITHNGTQKGIMASPSYSGLKETYNLERLYKSDQYFNGYTKFFAYLNVKEIYGNAKPILENGQKNQTLYLGTFNITDSFALYYEETNSSMNGFLIEYTIYFGDFALSTTIPTTTSVPPTTSATKNSAKLSVNNNFSMILLSVLSVFLL